MQHAAVSDIGMRRTSNQDSYVVVPAGDLQTWYDRGHLFLIADGMGGHAAGELASQLAADGIPHSYYVHQDESPHDAILSAIVETNTQINQRGEANTDFYQMGTTASVLLLLPQGALVAHVGDSRAYRLRGNQLEQLTFDHSLVWEMKATGKVDVSTMIPKNQITRSLGPHPTVQVDLEGPLPIELGDTFLLCSDGLNCKVDDDEIGALLGSLDPPEAAQVLVDLANLRGGPDNVTVVVVRITGHQMTTSVADTASPRIGGDYSKRSVHPLLWVVTGLCVLAAPVMFAAEQPIPALVAGAGGAIAVLVAVIQKLGGFIAENENVVTARQRLGSGPHARITCPANDVFVTRLDNLGKELRAAALEGKWNLDIARYDNFFQNALEAAKSGNYIESIRQYARGISYVMKQLRERRGRGATDSSVDYA